MDHILKIIIVDDEPITKQALRYIIQGIPEFNIIGEASNGAEGLELLKKLSPDVIISDIVMPTMDGLSFCQVVRSLYPHIAVIVLSGYNQFDYVRTAFQLGITDYILKPNLEPDLLQNKLLTIANKKGLSFSGTAIYKISEKNILSYLLEQAQEIDRPYLIEYFSRQYFFLLGGTLPLRDSSDSGGEYLMNRVQEAFSALSLNDSFYTAIGKNRQSFYLLFQSDTAAFFTETLLQFILNSDNSFLSSIFWSYSPTYCNILDSGQQAVEIEAALKQKFYYPDTRIISSNIPVAAQLNISHTAYLQCLGKKQVDSAKMILLEYLYARKLYKDIPQKDLKKEIDSLIYNAFSILFPKQSEPIHHLKQKAFAAIDASNHIDALIASIEDIFISFYTVIKAEEKTPSLYQEILLYIKKNHVLPLTLHTIAQEFHISYSYLSSYFNAVGGSSFNEQLNQIRIQHACDLLKNTESSIAEISQMVGYSEQSYFGKIFKQIVGDSPSGYRRKN